MAPRTGIVKENEACRECVDCDDRTVDCRDTCDTYQRWKYELAEKILRGLNIERNSL